MAIVGHDKPALLIKIIAVVLLKKVLNNSLIFKKLPQLMIGAPGMFHS